MEEYMELAKSRSFNLLTKCPCNKNRYGVNGFECDKKGANRNYRSG